MKTNKDLFLAAANLFAKSTVKQDPKTYTLTLGRYRFDKYQVTIYKENNVHFTRHFSTKDMANKYVKAAQNHGFTPNFAVKF